ncbi:hypothetical protein BELL_0024g00270 [Botrytis elliptica]|uniref:Uncharacterized protein n=1 Tax=Botrytis elliptica TaxID=278938 RepID=A0A4Z1K1T0_9HELO|nr:hypothetical protein EAE99_007581 [Botrytis elliptica]TGO79748.1 hypothetical protein BELL_0024g00270 [Botrytis elliptica]
MTLWSSVNDKILPPSGPTGKKRKGSNKSGQQTAKPKENTKHATAATSVGKQRGDRSTGGTDASRHSFYSAGDSCDTSKHPNDEVQNFHKVRAHERGKQERNKEESRKQMGYGSESSRF